MSEAGSQDFADIVTPSDQLQGQIFTLPEHIRADARLVQMYDTIVEQLRREASGISMNTVQQLLLERIAFFYVDIRYREETGGFSATQQKDFNVYWLSLTGEFNKLLSANIDKLRDAIIMEAMQVISSNLGLISDEKDRASFRQAISRGFAESNL